MSWLSVYLPAALEPSQMGHWSLLQPVWGDHTGFCLLRVCVGGAAGSEIASPL